MRHALIFFVLLSACAAPPSPRLHALAQQPNPWDVRWLPRKLPSDGPAPITTLLHGVAGWSNEALAASLSLVDLEATPTSDGLLLRDRFPEQVEATRRFLDDRSRFAGQEVTVVAAAIHIPFSALPRLDRRVWLGPRLGDVARPTGALFAAILPRGATWPRFDDFRGRHSPLREASVTDGETAELQLGWTTDADDRLQVGLLRAPDDVAVLHIRRQRVEASIDLDRPLRAVDPRTPDDPAADDPLHLSRTIRFDDDLGCTLAAGETLALLQRATPDLALLTIVCWIVRGAH